MQDKTYVAHAQSGSLAHFLVRKPLFELQRDQLARPRGQRLQAEPSLFNRIHPFHPLIGQRRRISLRFHLTALSAEETALYLRHRLHIAGYQGDFPFTEEALDLLYQATRGIPREINRVCKIGLDHVLNSGLERFTGEAISAVVEDLRRHGGLFDGGADGL